LDFCGGSVSDSELRALERIAKLNGSPEDRARYAAVLCRHGFFSDAQEELVQILRENPLHVMSRVCWLSMGLPFIEFYEEPNLPGKPTMMRIYNVEITLQDAAPRVRKTIDWLVIDWFYWMINCRFDQAVFSPDELTNFLSKKNIEYDVCLYGGDVAEFHRSVVAIGRLSALGVQTSEVVRAEEWVKKILSDNPITFTRYVSGNERIVHNYGRSDQYERRTELQGFFGHVHQLPNLEGVVQSLLDADNFREVDSIYLQMFGAHQHTRAWWDGRSATGPFSVTLGDRTSFQIYISNTRRPASLIVAQPTNKGFQRSNKAV
jgi:hypothetical protein